MNKAERELARRERERIRRRNLKIVKLCGIAMLVVIAGSLLVSAISGALSSGNGENGTSSGSLGISVSQASSSDPSALPAMANAVSTPTPTPVPADPRLSDPLLVLVNSENPLPDNWKVDPVTVAGEEQVDSRAYDDLTAMLRAANDAGVTLWLASSYRSVELQQEILDRAVQERVSQRGMTEEEAMEDALHTINRPGYSEHHTGLAVDFNDVSNDFEETDAYYWLEEHAAEYGFVQRYKKSKVEYTGINNESWHYRYVGKEYAQDMEERNYCLEEYIEYLKNGAN